MVEICCPRDQINDNGFIEYLRNKKYILMLYIFIVYIFYCFNEIIDFFFLIKVLNYF